ncbi:MAG: hypothetical protein A3F31_04805 [Candidatus Levybacteria bacterium RIFCSPHIGHO2_12_FULL_38_12]|nr:MAG: hypothetical protein A2770_04490 [Candidatus Levybacteria bacterium RIFCSPHIGHO2_01_FULL_38_12]OGH21770.1 MAG: hypothetical protein A3D75_01100 [Candidatus Levybacteria bacterium RIFCSPHIGHO2_02_FULL_37_18]OGH22572.1 MAG: hypothetical protein A3F31_04805 [Candidatus Levybacteria bacterium RIFCSPHIGHO2_12_FULL_38_12]OGH33391.1 MAG: hypothetical protein A3A47_04050 [Candidatus Levybacteria bacterium RIFCSPLOWO2_01_FULL_37_20]OGH44110.1 MAG: hypothetical protein A3J14_05175 [Candidatus Lev
MTSKEKILLSIILLGAFFVRLYRFDNPIADWHSWRQTDTSAVSRNFVLHGFDILHPKFDDLSNVASGIDNPHGYRFVEFPLYNLFQAGFFSLFDFFTLEQWGRLVTIFSSLLSTLFIFLIVKRRLNIKTAFISAFFFAYLPYNIYYGRTILPDSTMVTAILGGTYFFDIWISSFGMMRYFILAFLFTSASLLLKPYAVFFVLPMIYIAYERFGFAVFKKWQLWIFFTLSVLPLIFWRKWMMQYPEGIPVNEWLLNGNGIRFRPAFFRWIFFERITKLISGYLGMIILFAGISYKKEPQKGIFFYSFLLSSLLYIFIFATGNVQHDYYQILIMPTVSIYMGIGTVFIYSFLQRCIHKVAVVLVVGVCIFLSFFLSWRMVKDYFNINNRSIVIAGRAINRLIPKDAKIIAPYDGDTSFLYQTERRGWASFEKPLPDMIKMGADYLVFLNPTKKDEELGNQYKIVSKTKEFILFKLR